MSIGAAGQGFEPRIPDSESGVIPFHHPAKLNLQVKIIT